MEQPHQAKAGAVKNKHIGSQLQVISATTVVADTTIIQKVGHAEKMRALPAKYVEGDIARSPLVPISPAYSNKPMTL
jgi:hypothetical protein